MYLSESWDDAERAEQEIVEIIRLRQSLSGDAISFEGNFRNMQL